MMLELLRFFLRGLLRRLFRISISGLENLSNDKSVIICNHTSFLDGILLSLFIENGSRRFLFALDTEHAKQPIFRFATTVLSHSITVSQTDLHGVRRIIRRCENNPTLWPMIFPEGRITNTGSLMKIYPGAGLIADKITDGYVLPVCILGAKYSKYSRMQGKFQLRWFPKIHIHIGARCNVHPQKDGKRNRRRHSEEAKFIARLLEQTAFDACNLNTTITADFIRQSGIHGAGRVLHMDYPTPKLTYRQIFRGAYILGRVFAGNNTAQKNNIGILLPTSAGATVVFHAAQFYGLTPVLLNPTVGNAQAMSACETAQLDTVYTAERLLQKSEAAAAMVAHLESKGIRVIRLEDIRAALTLPQKLRGLFASFFMHAAGKRLPGYRADPNSPACILFTSGSEGAPKGVVLSHRNLIANAEQVLVRLEATHADVLLNALPIFHSFGLMAGVILPYKCGARTIHFPTPLDYRLIPEIAYVQNVSIFFSANTFLMQYGRFAHQKDFYRLRAVFAGAEKLQDNTVQLWVDKFGIRILQGYGVTETAPVISFNIHGHFKAQSVGRLVSGLEYRLQPVDGVKQGGRLLVRGSNVMLGYYLHDAPGVLQPPADGWHDTGDIADIDEDDYLTILGRAKRFIKVAGEMVPLDKIESIISRHLPDGNYAAIGVPDEKRGEKLVLITDTPVAPDTINDILRTAGIPELWFPRDIKTVSKIPLLATGKINYLQLTQDNRQG